MRACPQHGDCRWFDLENADTRGSDLGFGVGWRNGRDFAEAHDPMPDWDYPISNCRGDLFAIGFYRGCVAEWCPMHHRHELQDHDFMWRGISNSYCFSHYGCIRAVQVLALGGRYHAPGMPHEMGHAAYCPEDHHRLLWT